MRDGEQFDGIVLTAQITTTFAGAVAATSDVPEAVRDVLGSIG